MFVKLTARLIVNAHELNNEASVGTFTDIRKIKLVNSKNEVGEFSAVSGNMLKHYHFIYFKRLLEQMGCDKFCQYCRREESWRLAGEDERLVRPQKTEGKKARERMKASLEKLIESEKKIITSCAVEDVHGYLSPVPGFPIKRDSRVRFSWLVPTEDSEEAIVTVIHNRVAKIMELAPEAEEKGEEKKEKGEEKAPAQMMAFYKQYASAIYSLNSSIDLGRISVSDYTMNIIEESEGELEARKLATLKAYVPIMQGEAGASMSRALPIVKPLECLIIASKFPAVPNPISSYYSNYKEENLKLLKSLQALTTEIVYVIGGPGQTYQTLKEAFSSNDKICFIEAESPVDTITKLIELLFPKKGSSP